MPGGMILAAGRGTRLGELTAAAPKPLLPVANRPVMAQGLNSLRRSGITEMCVNVSYRAEQIVEAFSGEYTAGINLHWSIEDEPCGTAGGMKRVQRRLAGDRVVVVAGDAMLDVDLDPLLDAHAARGAFATLATLEVTDPSQYGVVVTDAEGRIIEFQEKPIPGTEISRQANTGIYVFEPEIFELIPAGAFCDFALHVFPEILRRGLPFYAAPVQGYWRDIGNPGDYLQANMDFLDGRIRIDGDGSLIDGSLIGADAQIDGAQLTRCVVGARAALPAGCALTECVVWPDVTLEEPLALTAAVLTPHGIFEIREKKALALHEAPVGR